MPEVVSTISSIVTIASNPEYPFNSSAIDFDDNSNPILSLINASVLILGTIGIVFNGFSIHVLWKCLTTGELGIKLVLFSDLMVCLFYILGNIQHNIVNRIIENRINTTNLVNLAKLNQSIINIPIFVSNWWIIIILFLRLMTLYTPYNKSLLNKSIYNRVAYILCCVVSVLLIIPLRFYLRYVRIIIYVVPVILVSVEASVIIYSIKKLERINTSSPNGHVQHNTFYADNANCSTGTTTSKINQYHVKRYKQRPYNHIIITILTLALNFLILDCLQFIDTLHVVFANKPLPMWFILPINIFSLLKRIMNFIILCAKCRHFRKIMRLKLNLLMQPWQRRKCCLREDNDSRPVQRPNQLLRNNHPNNSNSSNLFSPLYPNQPRNLFVKEDLIPLTRIDLRRNNHILFQPASAKPAVVFNYSQHPVNSYCSAFDVTSNASLISNYPQRLYLSGKY